MEITYISANSAHLISLYSRLICDMFTSKLYVHLCMCVCFFTDGKDLYIEKAVQKAYLEVTEEGAEGAVGSGRLIFYSSS